MFSKRGREGYALIDHTDSPGITPEFLRAHNIDAPAVGAGVKFESAVSVCHSCCNDILLNPDRSRERAWCMKHDAYLCDWCAAAQKAGAVCVPYSQRLEQYYEQLVRNSQPQGV